MTTIQQVPVQHHTEHQDLGPRLFIAIVGLIAVFINAALGISGLSDAYFLGILGGAAVIAAGFFAGTRAARGGGDGPPPNWWFNALRALVILLIIFGLGRAMIYFGLSEGVIYGVYGGLVGLLFAYAAMSVTNCTINILAVIGGIGLTGSEWASEAPNKVASFLSALFVNSIKAAQGLLAAAFDAAGMSTPSETAVAFGVIVALIALGSASFWVWPNAAQEL
jgi:hypothetical protein